MIVFLKKKNDKSKRYEEIHISPDTCFDEDWILSKIGNVGTTRTVELTIVETPRGTIKIKISNLDEKNPPPMKTKRFQEENQ